MTELFYILLVLLGLVGVYVAARLISAAYFKSKHDYETERKRHGTNS